VERRKNLSKCPNLVSYGAGRLTRIFYPTQPTSRFVANTYDALGRVKPTQITDPLGRVTTMSCDSATGDLVTVIGDSGCNGNLNAMSARRRQCS
jgi:hypothetical protein